MMPSLIRYSSQNVLVKFYSKLWSNNLQDIVFVILGHYISRSEAMQQYIINTMIMSIFICFLCYM